MLFVLELVSQVSEAATYYVGKNGSESYSCWQAQSPETPVLRVGVGIQCLNPGDTLMVGGGTYFEMIGPFMYIPSGTPDAPITIMANPGETVVLQMPYDGPMDYPLFDLYLLSNITISGFVFDGAGWAGNATQFEESSNIRFENNEIRNARYNGILVGANYNTFVGNNVHANGGYGMYLVGGFNTIEGNEFHRNGYFGIVGYSQTDSLRENTVRTNLVHNNGQFAYYPGILMGGYRNQIYNNTIWSENGPAIEIGYGYYPTEISVFGNTIYGDHWQEIVVDWGYDIYVYGNSISPLSAVSEALFTR